MLLKTKQDEKADPRINTKLHESSVRDVSCEFVDRSQPLERNDVASHIRLAASLLGLPRCSAVLLLCSFGRFLFRRLGGLFREFRFLLGSHVTGNNFAFRADFHLQLNCNFAMQDAAAPRRRPVA